MMRTYAFWHYEELVPLLGINNLISLKDARGTRYVVTGTSSRLRCFLRDRHCATCTHKGVLWFLQSHGEIGRPAEMRPHLNLYSYGKGGLILMTQDHIFPKSAGGRDDLDNLQTMCNICNQRKGATIPDGYQVLLNPPQRDSSEVDDRKLRTKRLQTLYAYADYLAALERRTAQLQLGDLP